MRKAWQRAFGAVLLSLAVGSCAMLPMTNPYLGATQRPINQRAWLGGVIGAVALGGITAISVAGMRDSEEKAVGWALGVPLMAGMGAAVGSGIGWLLSLHGERAVHPKTGPNPAALPLDRDGALAQARQFESASQWPQAWGAYRRAKDLGPPSQFIDDKLALIEAKMGVPSAVPARP